MNTHIISHGKEKRHSDLEFASDNQRNIYMRTQVEYI